MNLETWCGLMDIELDCSTEGVRFLGHNKFIHFKIFHSESRRKMDIVRPSVTLGWVVLLTSTFSYADRFVRHTSHLSWRADDVAKLACHPYSPSPD
ncbi:hypothetical protein CEXT_370281 [Caerostris extrusa]|uniref:Uncharacterized protein n=1 Tax=Caerostris extrusa TaxID=172846 RepID=A0AAV4NHC4_CAEEX|nr:hypothetical protein CEXT_370281 [Caerostris extrusa]